MYRISLVVRSPINIFGVSIYFLYDLTGKALHDALTFIDRQLIKTTITTQSIAATLPFKQPKLEKTTPARMAYCSAQNAWVDLGIAFIITNIHQQE